MDTLFARSDFPDHLFTVPSLDFGNDLFWHRISGLWFRLGEYIIDSQSDKRFLQPVILKQTMLLEPGCFADIYDEIGWIPNVLDRLGKPKNYIMGSGQGKEYGYDPFYRFNIGSISCEPLVFRCHTNSKVELFINPDLQLYLELEEITPGIWWDPRRGEEVLKRKIIESECLQVIEIRTNHLRKYLQARQQALLVGHYRLSYLPAPSQEILDTFRAEKFEEGSPDEGKKVIVQNFGPIDETREEPYIGRFLHLWFEIQPPKINIDDPWAEEPPFDPYEFTLPTQKGAVAPARFRYHEENREREYDGVALPVAFFKT